MNQYWYIINQSTSFTTLHLIVMSSLVSVGYDWLSPKSVWAQAFLIFDDLNYFEKYCSRILYFLSIGIFLIFFMRLGLWVWGRNTTEVECHSHHVRVDTINTIYNSWYWPWSPGWGVSSFSITKLLFFSPFHIVPYGRKSCVLPTFKEYEFMLPPWRAEYPHKLFRILLQWKFVSTPPFIYSVIYIGMYSDNHFIFWIIIQHYFIYFVAQIVPALAF